jgi:hypothetical protein
VLKIMIIHSFALCHFSKVRRRTPTFWRFATNVDSNDSFRNHSRANRNKLTIPEPTPKDVHSV